MENFVSVDVEKRLETGLLEGTVAGRGQGSVEILHDPGGKGYDGC